MTINGLEKNLVSYGEFWDVNYVYILKKKMAS